MNEATTFYASLPKSTRKALLRDWVKRGKEGIIRGEGLASHALYIDMIAQENDYTIDDILNLNGHPV